MKTIAKNIGKSKKIAHLDHGFLGKILNKYYMRHNNYLGYFSFAHRQNPVLEHFENFSNQIDCHLELINDHQTNILTTNNIVNSILRNVQNNNDFRKKTISHNNFDLLNSKNYYEKFDTKRVSKNTNSIYKNRNLIKNFTEEISHIKNILNLDVKSLDYSEFVEKKLLIQKIKEEILKSNEKNTSNIHFSDNDYIKLTETFISEAIKTQDFNSIFKKRILRNELASSNDLKDKGAINNIIVNSLKEAMGLESFNRNISDRIQSLTNEFKGTIQNREIILSIFKKVFINNRESLLKANYSYKNHISNLKIESKNRKLIKSFTEEINNVNNILDLDVKKLDYNEFVEKNLLIEKIKEEILKNNEKHTHDIHLSDNDYIKLAETFISEAIKTQDFNNIFKKQILRNELASSNDLKDKGVINNIIVNSLKETIGLESFSKNVSYRMQSLTKDFRETPQNIDIFLSIFKKVFINNKESLLKANYSYKNHINNLKIESKNRKLIKSFTEEINNVNNILDLDVKNLDYNEFIEKNVLVKKIKEEMLKSNEKTTHDIHFLDNDYIKLADDFISEVIKSQDFNYILKKRITRDKLASNNDFYNVNSTIMNSIKETIVLESFNRNISYKIESLTNEFKESPNNISTILSTLKNVFMNNTEGLLKVNYSYKNDINNLKPRSLIGQSFKTNNSLYINKDLHNQLYFPYTSIVNKRFRGGDKYSSSWNYSDLTVNKKINVLNELIDSKGSIFSYYLNSYLSHKLKLSTNELREQPMNINSYSSIIRSTEKINILNKDGVIQIQDLLKANYKSLIKKTSKNDIENQVKNTEVFKKLLNKYKHNYLINSYVSKINRKKNFNYNDVLNELLYDETLRSNYYSNSLFLQELKSLESEIDVNLNQINKRVSKFDKVVNKTHKNSFNTNKIVYIDSINDLKAKKLINNLLKVENLSYEHDDYRINEENKFSQLKINNLSKSAKTKLFFLNKLFAGKEIIKNNNFITIANRNIYKQIDYLYKNITRNKIDTVRNENNLISFYENRFIQRRNYPNHLKDTLNELSSMNNLSFARNSLHKEEILNNLLRRDFLSDNQGKVLNKVKNQLILESIFKKNIGLSNRENTLYSYVNNINRQYRPINAIGIIKEQNLARRFNIENKTYLKNSSIDKEAYNSYRTRVQKNQNQVKELLDRKIQKYYIDNNTLISSKDNVEIYEIIDKNIDFINRNLDKYINTSAYDYRSNLLSNRYISLQSHRGIEKRFIKRDLRKFQNNMLKGDGTKAYLELFDFRSFPNNVKSIDNNILRIEKYSAKEIVNKLNILRIHNKRNESISSFNNFSYRRNTSIEDGVNYKGNGINEGMYNQYGKHKFDSVDMSYKRNYNIESDMIKKISQDQTKLKKVVEEEIQKVKNQSRQEVNIISLTERVYKNIERKLKSERQRRGMI